MTCLQTFKTLNISISNVLEIKFTFVLVASLFMIPEWLNFRLQDNLLSLPYFDLHEEDEPKWILGGTFLFFFIVVQLSCPCEPCLLTQHSVTSQPH